MDELNDPVFVARLISGDVESFDFLFSRVVPKICDFLVKLFAVTKEDAEEIAADTMVKAHGALRRFQPNRRCKLTTWVFQIAKNVAIDYRRKEQHDQKIGETTRRDEQGLSRATQRSSQGPIWQSNAVAASDCGAHTEIELCENDRKEVVRMRRCLDSLEETDRSVLSMQLIMSYEEIALIEGCSAGALRVRHSRAKKRLAEAYAREDNR